MTERKSKSSVFFAWFFGLLVGVGAMILVFGVILNYQGTPKDEGPGMLEVEAKAIDFINNNLLTPEMDAEIIISGEEKDVYEITVNIGDEQVFSYVTKDGKFIFPVGYIMEDSPVNNGQENPVVETPGIVRTNKPIVELFVMSYCPYGLQAEKGILPAVAAFGGSIDFKIRFVNYAMHGEKELAENTRQYCIQETQPEKLVEYLACFSEAGNTISCGEQVELSEAMIDVCIKTADDKYNIATNFAAKDTWLSDQYPIYEVDDISNKKYGVRGSPTLVINGVVTQSGRDSQSYMRTICDSFNNMTNTCSNDYINMSDVSPSPGFGFDATTAGIEGICG